MGIFSGFGHAHFPMVLNGLRKCLFIIYCLQVVEGNLRQLCDICAQAETTQNEVLDHQVISIKYDIRHRAFIKRTTGINTLKHGNP